MAQEQCQLENDRYAASLFREESIQPPGQENYFHEDVALKGDRVVQERVVDRLAASLLLTTSRVSEICQDGPIGARRWMDMHNHFLKAVRLRPQKACAHSLQHCFERGRSSSIRSYMCTPRFASWAFSTFFNKLVLTGTLCCPRHRASA